MRRKQLDIGIEGIIEMNLMARIFLLMMGMHIPESKSEKDYDRPWLWPKIAIDEIPSNVEVKEKIKMEKE